MGAGSSSTDPPSATSGQVSLRRVRADVAYVQEVVWHRRVE